FERRVRELRAEAHRHPRDDLVPGAAASGDYLILPDDLPERIGHDGKRLFELFARIGDEGLVLTERTRHRLRGLAALIDDEFREDESVAAAFRALLASDRAAAALRALHSIGVLGAYVPQFGALEGLIPYDVSHAYPADEHTLLVIEFFDRLRAGLGPERFVDAAKSLARPDLVRLVLLLHDTGKAGGPGHRERGARLAPVACLRLSLAADETDFVVRLVREHESLAYAAYTRDVDDPAVARDLAAHIGDADALDALFVLTYCDMRAVGPGVFTPWRGGLIAALYDRVAEALSPGAPREAGDDRATRVRAALAGAFDAALVDDYIARMQAHHPAWLSPELAARHLTALSRYRVESKPVVDVHWDDDASGELVFCAPDAPGLLAVVAGVCVAERLSVLSLQAVTMEQTGDGSVALDTAKFQWHEAAPPRESVRERIGERLAAHVDDVLAGRARVQDLVAAGARRVLGAKAVAPIATEVRIDNHAAPRHTIVEVATADRFGLLYLVTHAIHEFGLSIALAKVNTIAGRAIDAFYVLDADGQKVARSAAPALREAITAAVKSPI
ncbi:HD domain-containing protein, partial [bacterium]|nr:HD domain-containing protein [bacterium]